MIGLSHSIHPYFIHKWLYCYHFFVHTTIWFDVMIEISFLLSFSVSLSLGEYFLYSCCFIRNVFSIENRILICECMVFFRFWFVFSLCGVLVHAWYLRHEWKRWLSSIHWLFLFLAMLRKEWERKRWKQIMIGFIFADPINLESEWMKSNRIHIRNIQLNYIYIYFWWCLCFLFCLNARQSFWWRFFWHLQIQHQNRVYTLFENSWIESQFWFTF